MSKTKRIISLVFALICCIFFAVSVADTNESAKQTDFSQETIEKHVEKLSENGPRSIADKESNQKALDYIISELESYGAVNEDTTEKTAYLVQDFVAEDERYQNWYLKNVILHIPANADDSTGEAVMFMGHYDSVPMGEGASDDAVACGVMLEAARYYLEKMEDGYTIKNDLVFCFVNGEEYGLYGSEAFMKEFRGFNNITERIKFGTNLESRGTSGTLIMFETSKNNYNTVKLFSEVNKNLFSCSIATMVYDMMPNGTDFTNFKEYYQGVNMANVGGGEDYHTQNDNPENVGASYLSQQAQIVDGLIERLSNYNLNDLYDAEESAIFFSYLNITTVVYNHVTVIVFAVIAIALLIANVVISLLNRRKNAKNTAKGIAAIIIGSVLAAAATYLCYYLFQAVAAIFGVIDWHTVGTISYSNTAIIVGIGILALAITVFVSNFAVKHFKITPRDLTRAFAYIHIFLGILFSFVLADASYLFIFSGIMLMINELLITCVKKTDVSEYHGELLATALYFPVVIPVLVLATTALGLTMAYVYGLIFALVLFGAGICMTQISKYISVKSLVQTLRKKAITAGPNEGAAHILAIALVIFLSVSLSAPNASVNLQGKQGIAKLPYDDALVYVVNGETGESNYRIYDLNAYSALTKYSPEMTFVSDSLLEHYSGEGEKIDTVPKLRSKSDGNALDIEKTVDDSLVYLMISTNEENVSFTIDDGITVQNYKLVSDRTDTITVHSDCTITVNGGTASVWYCESIRDYSPLIPEAYKNDSEQLHFNLWLTNTYKLGE